MGVGVLEHTVAARGYQFRSLESLYDIVSRKLMDLYLAILTAAVSFTNVGSGRWHFGT